MRYHLESWTELARQAVLKTVAPPGVQGSTPWLSAKHACVAQTAEHLSCKQAVAGSMPVACSKYVSVTQSGQSDCLPNSLSSVRIRPGTPYGSEAQWPSNPLSAERKRVRFSPGSPTMLGGPTGRDTWLLPKRVRVRVPPQQPHVQVPTGMAP